MATCRVIKSVLRNFLGTYTSRNTEHDGYWLFGFLVSDLREQVFNLLDRRACVPETVLAEAEGLAATKFADQVHKAGLDASQVREATLTIRRGQPAERESIEGGRSTGYSVNFHAAAVMDIGTRYELEQLIFVACHDPRVERRSGRLRQPPDA